MGTKKSRTQPDAATTEPRIIKKYPNRRLYDTVKRSYITLADIKKYVLEQLPFCVIDAQTTTDLTKATLFQVLTEQETTAHTFFTTELLQQMIRLYHENLQNVFSQYFEQALTQFIQQKETWSQHFAKSTASFTTPFATMQELTELQSRFWKTFLHPLDKK